MDRKKETLGYLFAVLLYGMTGTLLRYTNVPGEVEAFVRGVIGCATILIIVKITGKQINKNALFSQWKLLVISGACLGLNWVLLFAAYKSTSVAIASLLNNLAPIVLLAISPVIFKTRLNWKQILCVIAVLVGVILISGILEMPLENINKKGIFLALGSMFLFMILLICNRFFKELNALDKTVSQLMVAAAVMLPFMLISVRNTTVRPDLRTILILLFVGIFNTGIAYICYFNGVGTLPIQTVAILAYLEPAESVILSALVLREPLSPLGILGAVLIIGAAACGELLSIHS